MSTCDQSPSIYGGYIHAPKIPTFHLHEQSGTVGDTVKLLKCYTSTFKPIVRPIFHFTDMDNASGIMKNAHAAMQRHLYLISRVAFTAYGISGGRLHGIISKRLVFGFVDSHAKSSRPRSNGVKAAVGKQTHHTCASGLSLRRVRLPLPHAPATPMMERWWNLGPASA